MSTYIKFKAILKVVFLSLGAFFVAQITAPVFVVLISKTAGFDSSKLQDAIENNNLVRFFLVLVVEFFTVAIIYWYLKKFKLTKQSIGLPKDLQKTDIIKALKMYFMYFIVYLLIVFIASKFKLVNPNQTQDIGFKRTGGIELYAIFVSLVILPPIAEEILFRGFMYFGLRKFVKPITAGIIVSLLFGVAHLEFGNGGPLNFAAALDTAVLSSVLVYGAEKYKTIMPGIYVHAIKNFVAFYILFIAKK